jgi:beta-hydroxylase
MLLDLARFPFIPMLESRWRAIRAELDALQPDQFMPWFDRDSYSDGWKLFGFVQSGRPEHEPMCAANRQACPATASALASIEALHEAAFSLLDPGALIYPHEEPDTQTVRCHLALRIPPAGCHLKLGDQLVTWSEGKCLVFDNRRLHAACNMSDQQRVVLLVDVQRDHYLPSC